MKRHLAAILFAASLATPLAPQQFRTQTAQVQLIYVVPPTAGMNVAPADLTQPISALNPLVAEIRWNLTEPPTQIAVEYNGQTLSSSCGESACHPLAAMGSVKIVLPYDAMGREPKVTLVVV